MFVRLLAAPESCSSCLAAYVCQKAGDETVQRFFCLLFGATLPLPRRAAHAVPCLPVPAASAAP